MSQSHIDLGVTTYWVCLPHDHVQITNKLYDAGEKFTKILLIILFMDNWTLLKNPQRFFQNMICCEIIVYLHLEYCDSLSTIIFSIEIGKINELIVLLNTELNCTLKTYSQGQKIWWIFVIKRTEFITIKLHDISKLPIITL